MLLKENEKKKKLRDKNPNNFNAKIAIGGTWSSILSILVMDVLSVSIERAPKQDMQPPIEMRPHHKRFYFESV